MFCNSVLLRFCNESHGNRRQKFDSEKIARRAMEAADPDATEYQRRRRQTRDAAPRPLHWLRYHHVIIFYIAFASDCFWITAQNYNMLIYAPRTQAYIVIVFYVRCSAPLPRGRPLLLLRRIAGTLQVAAVCYVDRVFLAKRSKTSNVLNNPPSHHIIMCTNKWTIIFRWRYLGET